MLVEAGKLLPLSKCREGSKGFFFIFYLVKALSYGFWKVVKKKENPKGQFLWLLLGFFGVFRVL